MILYPKMRAGCAKSETLIKQKYELQFVQELP